jgi:hypothetical protein
MRRLRFAGLSLLAASAMYGQAVVSTHSGVLNFSEGEIFLDDQATVQKPGTFPALHEGSVMRTAQGRAEVLLTPGVFLRIDQNSSFKMVATGLADTRVELLTGSAILDSSDAAKTKGLVVLFRAYQIRFPERGLYRINTEPGVLQPYSGVAEIAGDGPAPVKVDDEHQYFLDVGIKTEKYGEGMVDGFTEWARNRSEAISADNSAAAASAGDPADLPTDGYAGALGVDPGLGGVPGITVPGTGLPGTRLPGAGLPGIGLPRYPSLAGMPSILNGGLYPGLTPYLGVPLGYYYPTVRILAVPVYGRVPRPFPRPVYPIRPYTPPGLSTIVGGVHRNPALLQPVRPAPGIRPMPGVRPMTSVRPVMPVRPMGGVHAIGHR